MPAVPVAQGGTCPGHCGGSTASAAHGSPTGMVTGMPRPEAVCPGGLEEVSLLGGTRVTAAACARGAGCSHGWIRPAHCPAVRCACAQGLICWARGRGCSRSSDAPKEGTKAGTGEREAPSPRQRPSRPSTFPPAAPASLGSAVDGRGWNSLAGVKANVSSQQLPGSRARGQQRSCDPTAAVLQICQLSSQASSPPAITGSAVSTGAQHCLLSHYIKGQINPLIQGVCLIKRARAALAGGRGRAASPVLGAET